MTRQTLLHVEENLVRPRAERLFEHDVGEVPFPGRGERPVKGHAIAGRSVVPGQETVGGPARTHRVRGGRTIADPEQLANGFHGG